MRKLSCETFDRHALWLQLVLPAADLTVFTQLLTLDGEPRLAEPVTLRCQLFHVPSKDRSHRPTDLHAPAEHLAVDTTAHRRVRPARPAAAHRSLTVPGDP